MAQEQKCKYFYTSRQMFGSAMLSRLRECTAIYDPRQPPRPIQQDLSRGCMYMIRDTATGTDDSVRPLSDFSHTRLRIVFSSCNYTLQQVVTPAVQNTKPLF